ncbi:MAG: deoxyribodipyrimidine photolyase, partial [Planctomycetota bacterium]
MFPDPIQTVPENRVVAVNGQSPKRQRKYVLYWMIAQRRLDHNFGLQYAAKLAKQWNRPLVVFEPLRVRYRWASDRLHRFVIEGMRDNQAKAEELGLAYYPYVEERPGNGSPLLHRLAQDACAVVTDEYPCFFLPHLIRAVQDRIPAALLTVDSNGVLPLRATDERTFTVAHSYRRFMQKNIAAELTAFPMTNPIKELLPPGLGEGLTEHIDPKTLRRWPVTDLTQLLRQDGLARIPIDHTVTPTPETPGGTEEAKRRLDLFVAKHLGLYNDDRNHPDEVVTTGLSPHLHFGHISPHEMVKRLLQRDDWSIDRLSKPNGKNHGFFGVSPEVDAVLDQLLTWREIGFNWAFQNPDTYDRLESLPDWAQKSLAETKDDPRPHVYTLEDFEHAQTHDPIWNAAQRQIVQTGVMHNYMRMLWGKKIFHWTATAQDALDIMVHLNNKYGLDGRDPNSYCGILWVLGRTDRAWGPKRPVFGSVRYMTSDSARRKLRLEKYLQRYAS